MSPDMLQSIHTQIKEAVETAVGEALDTDWRAAATAALTTANLVARSSVHILRNVLNNDGGERDRLIEDSKTLASTVAVRVLHEARKGLGQVRGAIREMKILQDREEEGVELGSEEKIEEGWEDVDALDWDEFDGCEPGSEMEADGQMQPIALGADTQFKSDQKSLMHHEPPAPHTDTFEEISLIWGQGEAGTDLVYAGDEKLF